MLKKIWIIALAAGIGLATTPIITSAQTPNSTVQKAAPMKVAKFNNNMHFAGDDESAASNKDDDASSDNANNADHSSSDDATE